jgi:translation initiation factor 2 alpha subunit (eIF-2alpha)
MNILKKIWGWVISFFSVRKRNARVLSLRNKERIAQSMDKRLKNINKILRVASQTENIEEKEALRQKAEKLMARYGF